MPDNLGGAEYSSRAIPQNNKINHGLTCASLVLRPSIKAEKPDSPFLLHKPEHWGKSNPHNPFRQLQC
jgi:hypothetical protein